MNNLIAWSDLPKELVGLVSIRVFSNVELLRLRSICKSWRNNSVTTNKRFHNRNRKRTLCPYSPGNPSLLSPASYFRVILSSYPNKGWLIKLQDVSESRKKLLSPFSRVSIKSSDQTLDLLEFTVSEIHQSYETHQTYDIGPNLKVPYNFSRVVVVENLVFVVDRKNRIKWCNSEAITSFWTRILHEKAEYFLDIIVLKDQIYALDLQCAIWWVSLWELNIYQYGPSTPMEHYDYEGNYEECKERRMVEYCGELCIIHRYCTNVRVKTFDFEKTIGFRVYKMDEELVEWVEMKSLGDKAIVMATDSCFSVLASEYYGCLENSIYFMDKEMHDKEVFKVFKLCDGSVIEKVDSTSFSHESCFQMFFPPFA